MTTGRNENCWRVGINFVDPTDTIERINRTALIEDGCEHDVEIVIERAHNMKVSARDLRLDVLAQS